MSCFRVLPTAEEVRVENIGFGPNGMHHACPPTFLPYLRTSVYDKQLQQEAETRTTDEGKTP